MNDEVSIQTDWFTIRRSAYAWSLVEPFGAHGIATLALCASVAVYCAFHWGPIRGLRGLVMGSAIYAAFVLYKFREVWERVGKKAEAHGTPRRFNFSPEGIAIEMQGKKSSLIPWSKIEKIEHRPGFTFLVFEKTRHHPILDDAFDRKEQARTLPAMLRRYSTLVT